MNRVLCIAAHGRENHAFKVQSVNCVQFKNLITPAVDDFLTGEERKEFEEHAGTCAACREQFEAEAAMKKAVRTYLPKVSAPQSVRDSVLSTIRNAPQPRSRMRAEFIRRARQVRPIGVAALLAAVLLLLVLFRGGSATTTIPDERNVIARSLVTFRALNAGELRPAFASGNHDRIESYLTTTTGIEVQVPRFRDFLPLGGLANKCNGIAVAHVVYSRGEKLLMMVELPLDEVLHGHSMSLPMNARSALLQTGWYSSTQPNGDVVVIWNHGTTLCAIVAQMNPEEIRQLLVEGEENGPAITTW